MVLISAVAAERAPGDVDQCSCRGARAGCFGEVRPEVRACDRKYSA